MKYPDCYPLVVDDDPDFTFLLSMALERIGVPQSQITVCSDGEGAIGRLSASGELPSFVMLDYQMPRRNGLEVLAWIRSKSSLASLPVFMLTSSLDPQHISRAFELGVGSYFIKPAESHALEAILEGMVVYCRSRKRAASLRKIPS